MSIKGDDEIKRITVDLERLKNEKEALEKAYKDSLDDCKKLTNQRDDLRTEVNDLNQRLKDMETVLEQSTRTTRTGKADFDDSKSYDKQREEIMRSLAEKDAKIFELSRKVESLSEQENEVAKLKDQLDEYRHAAEKLKRTETIIEKYKKKLEEGADLRRALKTAEQENRTLLQRNRQIEEEYNKVSNALKGTTKTS